MDTNCLETGAPVTWLDPLFIVAVESEDKLFDDTTVPVLLPFVKSACYFQPIKLFFMVVLPLIVQL